MNVQDVLKRFSLLANLDEKDASDWITLCSDAASYIMSKVKTNITLTHSDYLTLSYVASCLAFYRYELYNATRNACSGSFSVGDISVRSVDKYSALHAEKVYKEALASASNLLQDSDFAFVKV